MSKQLDFAVQFAHTCTRYGFAPADLAELIRLSDRAFKAGERYCNTGVERSNKPFKAVATKAKDMGMETNWPGLYPSFTNNIGQPVYLPQA